MKINKNKKHSTICTMLNEPYDDSLNKINYMVKLEFVNKEAVPYEI